MSDRQLIDSLRMGARNPDAWDIPGLLQDAAERIEALVTRLTNASADTRSLS